MDYSITLTMDEKTVDTLSGGKYSLYCFKAVAGPTETKILVWATPRYSLHTTLEWVDGYQVFTSLDEARFGEPVQQAAEYPIAPGQTLKVDNEHGTGSVQSGGMAGALSVWNTTGTPMACGASQEVRGSGCQPLCVADLYGNQYDRFGPVEKVLLTFSEKRMTVGTAVETVLQPSLLVDLTAQATSDVGYDIDEGWSGGVQTSHVPADRALTDVLLGDPLGFTAPLLPLSPGRRAASADDRPR